MKLNLKMKKQASKRARTLKERIQNAHKVRRSRIA